MELWAKYHGRVREKLCVLERLMMIKDGQTSSIKRIKGYVGQTRTIQVYGRGARMKP